MTDRTSFILSSFIFASFTLAMGCKPQANVSDVAGSSEKPRLSHREFTFTNCSISNSQFAQLIAYYSASETYRANSQNTVQVTEAAPGSVEKLDNRRQLPPCDTTTWEFLSQGIKNSKWTTEAVSDVASQSVRGFALSAEKKKCLITFYGGATGSSTLVRMLTEGELNSYNSPGQKRYSATVIGQDTYCLGGDI